MALNDPLGDMITRIRNAQMRKKSKVSTPGLAGCARACSTCSRPRATSAATPRSSTRTAASELEIELKYFDGAPVIREIARVSKPGRRVYASVKALPRINNGLGVAILSTPKGVMADHDARDANVGGEILCTVF